MNLPRAHRANLRVLVRRLASLACGLATGLTVHASAAEAQSVTLGTQNLYHWMKDYDQRLAKMKLEISEGIPEVIGFQEAAKWTNGKSLFNEFIQTTGYSAHHKVTNAMVVMHEGIGFASKLPATACADYELPATSFNSRQWINVCEFNVAFGPLIVINAHTSPGPWAVEKRTAQMDFILKTMKVQKPGVPIVIMGDLNDIYETVSFEGLKKLGYVDVLKGEGATYDSVANPYAQYSRTARLDYIFYHPDQLQLVDAGFMFKKNIVSDHWGLKATFTLKKTTGDQSPSAPLPSTPVTSDALKR